MRTGRPLADFCEGETGPDLCNRRVRGWRHPPCPAPFEPRFRGHCCRRRCCRKGRSLALRGHWKCRDAPRIDGPRSNVILAALYASQIGKRSRHGAGCSQIAMPGGGGVTPEACFQHGDTRRPSGLIPRGAEPAMAVQGQAPKPAAPGSHHRKGLLMALRQCGVLMDVRPAGWRDQAVSGQFSSGGFRTVVTTQKKRPANRPRTPHVTPLATAKRTVWPNATPSEDKLIRM